MASFNVTRVYLHTRPAKNGQDAYIYRVPVPQVNESFYFNQESVKAAVYYYSDNTQRFKESSIASIHLTNKRLILLAQSTSIASTKPNRFDTCEFQLSDFQSLKSEMKYQKGLRFDIKTIRNENIKIDITFNHRKDANRRDSLKEYIKMATSAILSSRVRCQGSIQQQQQQLQQQQQQQQQQTWVQDELPSYLEATTNGNIAPPAYS